MATPDPYRLLGIDPGATAEEVRAAFRQKVRENHPDTAAEEPESGDIQDIIEAYRLLIDPDSRAKHDSDTGRRQQGVSGRSVKVTHRDTPRRSSTGRLRACTACGGAGTRTEESTCSECHGRGGFTALDRDHARVVRCRKCGGRGRLRVSRRCEVCDGSGARSD